MVLKAPDKADYRATATEAAVDLITELPAMNQHQFVLFAARLARTPKVIALVQPCLFFVTCTLLTSLACMSSTS